MDEPADRDLGERGESGESKVIAHDFGREPRLKARRFRQLLDLDALHELNIRNNPLPYLERASERIFQLKSALFDAARAGGDGEAAAAAEASETVTVGRAELERLLACRAIVRQAFETLVKGQPEDE